MTSGMYDKREYIKGKKYALKAQPNEYIYMV